MDRIKERISEMKQKLQKMKQKRHVLNTAQFFKFKPFSVKQKQVLTWWMPDSPVKDYDGIIADGAIRSGIISWTGEYYVSCDYGTQNATVFLLWRKADNGIWYCIREYYYSGRDKGVQKTDAEFSADLRKWLDGISPRHVVLDPAAASFKAQLKKDGFLVKGAKNDVLDGIRFVAGLLAQGKLLFDKSCKNTIKEFGSYIWDAKAADRGEDKPVKERDHCLTGDTLVDTVDGQIPIRDLVGKKGLVHCYDVKRKRKTVSKFYNVRRTGKDVSVYAITFKDGTVMKVTADHLVLTQRGWVQLQNLKKSAINEQI